MNLRMYAYGVTSRHFTVFGWTFIYQSVPNGHKLDTTSDGLALVATTHGRTHIFGIGRDTSRLRSLLRWD